MQWYGVVGPAGLPDSVTRLLNDSLNQTLMAQDVVEKLAAEAVQPLPMSAAQFAQYMRADLTRWTELARERKIQAES